MKTRILNIAFTGLFICLLSVPAIAGDMEHGTCMHGKTAHAAEMKSHAGHQKDHQKHNQMDHSGHMGKMIRTTTVDGYELMYHLIDMKARMKGMKGTEGMKMTHHLMVYIKGPKKKPIEQCPHGKDFPFPSPFCHA